MSEQQITLDEKVDGLVQTVGELVVAVSQLAKKTNENTEAIEDLARMTKDGFDAVDKRFNRVEDRLDKIEDRLERIEIIYITDHKKRIERLEDQMKELIMAGR